MTWRCWLGWHQWQEGVSGMFRWCKTCPAGQYRGRDGRWRRVEGY